MGGAPLSRKTDARGQPLTKSADWRYIVDKARIPMADNATNELLLEQLKNLNARFANVEDRLGRIENRLGHVEGHIAVLVKQSTDTNVDFAALTARVERIERRLALSDG
jgi:predicted nuclease with TOPRIM domain